MDTRAIERWGWIRFSKGKISDRIQLRPLVAVPRWHMNVIVHEGPGKDSRFGRFPCLADSRKEMLTVFVIPKNIGPLDASNHHMMNRSGCIQSRLSWHRTIISWFKLAANIFVNIVSNVPPLLPHNKMLPEGSLTRRWWRGGIEYFFKSFLHGFS
jgi:hypothetical protein